ncbi:MAG: 4-hydroxythreonine-4-phosphate dehydrogenase PdxA [Cyanobacteria bacterium SIG28]|nr:4-hydroxythreonine-4-phosphate dehydrogenase PdxA [Cyanobacteria bacterium SIG28]
MSNYSEKVLITTGDPNGIGAEVVIKSLNLLGLPPKDIVLVSNSKVLSFYGTLNNNYEILEVDYSSKVQPGTVTADAGDFAFRCLKTACDLKPKFIITAPTSKEAMHLAGHKFNGQTEILEKYLARENQKAEMLFVAGGFKVLLLTRHIALNNVAKNLTQELIIEKVARLQNFFKQKLGQKNPNFALCALNPHAGENGIIGTEEDLTMIPAVNALREKGVNITNPLPADTLFVNGVSSYLKNEKMPYDCYIACYHDQGLIPIKSVASKKTVNMTIGLDVIRTSPCHGTAFDIAGKNLANPESMIEAIKACF